MLDIVIVNWNSGTFLEKCLSSINNKYHTIVVDNGSTDGSIDCISSFKNLSLLQQSENHGFAKACNIGANLAKSDYILFLNPDAAIYPDTIDKVIAFMDYASNAQIGICGVQLIDENGNTARHCSRFPSVIRFLSHTFVLDRINPRLGRVMKEWDHNSTLVVDQVIGAFFLVRTNLFKSLGGFDERFFVYYEEVDFAYRAHLAGWKSTYFSGAKAFHAGNGTTKNIRAHRLFYSVRSRLLYVFKHFAWYKAVVVLLISVLIEPISRSILALLQRSWSGFKETWLAYCMLFRWLFVCFLNGNHDRIFRNQI